MRAYGSIAPRSVPVSEFSVSNLAFAGWAEDCLIR